MPVTMTPAAWARFEIIWERTTPAPEGAELPADYNPDNDPIPEDVRIAYEACMDEFYWGLEFCSPDERDGVVLATLVAMPEGEDAARMAARRRLLELATRNGWVDYLFPDHD
jgi:hypothetical protein